jgi:hypothetical protein
MVVEGFHENRGLLPLSTRVSFLFHLALSGSDTKEN